MLGEYSCSSRQIVSSIGRRISVFHDLHQPPHSPRTPPLPSLRYAKLMESLPSRDDNEISSACAKSWDEFLLKYKTRLSDDGTASPSDRVELMRSFNPRFTLRNWVLQNAIERAEGGDYRGIRELMDAADGIWGEATEGAVEGDTSKLLKGRTKDAPRWAHGVFNT